MITLIGMLGYGAYLRSQYQTLDQILLLSANHVEAGWRATGTSHVLEADISDLKLSMRLYGISGTLKRSSNWDPLLPPIDPVVAIKNPNESSLQHLLTWVPRLEPNVVTPPFTSFDVVNFKNMRWRTLVTGLDYGGDVLGYLEISTPMSELDHAAKRLGMWLLFLGLLALVGVYGLSLSLAEITLRPIDSLTVTVREIAESRNLSRRVFTGNSKDELGKLGETFNLMLSSLDEATTAQRRFVADASHELRAPLTAIQGNLELMHRYPDMPDEEREQALTSGIREAGRLGRLMQNLLSLARGDEGVQAVTRPVNIVLTCLEAGQEAKILLRDQTFETLGLENTEIWIDGDQDQIKQVLLIIFDNSIKYTASDGTIQLILQPKIDSAVISIRDNGIGISAEDLPHVFERFYRADRSRGREKGGTGLGLSIAKSIVSRLGGQIWIKSELGKGTTVYLSFPRT